MSFQRAAALAVATGYFFLPAAANAADTNSTPAAALTAQQQSDAFRDVPPESFAYQAVRQLASDHLIEGYPDGTFKGNRPLTRYEAAVITERVVALLSSKLSKPVTAPSVSPADLAAVRTLLGEFKSDIDSLNIRIGRIDDRLKSVEAHQTQDEAAQTKDRATAQAAVQALQARQAAANVHAVYFVRPGSFSDAVSAFSGSGAALAPGTALATNSGLGAGANTGRNTLTSGSLDHGVGYQVLRLAVDGALDSHVSYNLRLENRYYFDNASSNGSSNGTLGTASTAPQYCSNAGGSAFGAAGATCGNDYPTNSTMRLNYANMVYKDAAAGFSVTAGRYFQQNDTLGLAYADYFNGIMLGYTAKGLNLQAGYSFNFPSSSNGTSAGTSGQTMFGQAAYTFDKQVVGQLSFSTDVNPQLTLWNPSALASAATYKLYPGLTPSTGAYAAANTPIMVGSAFAQYNPTDYLTFAVEALHRFGNDPFTGAAWQQPNAVWAQAQVGAFRPTTFRAYGEGGFIQAGYNSLSGHTNIIGTTNYEQFFFANPNGYRIAYAGLHYWLGKNARVGVVYVHYNLIPGTDIPAGVQPTATSAGCAGCYIGNDIGNGVFLQGLVSF